MNTSMPQPTLAFLSVRLMRVPDTQQGPVEVERLEL